MKMKSSKLLMFVAASSIALGATLYNVGALAQAKPYPSQPVKVVVGFPAGGPLDQHVRMLIPKVQEVLGGSLIVDYKAGAGGAIGAEAVAKSAPDGYTIMLANTGVMVINGALYPKLPYNMARDFVPIARTAQQPLAFLTHPSVPANNLKEFIALAKQSPGKFNYGSAGNGGISHLVPEMLKTATGIFLVHIPYRGSAPAFTDLMAGQVQFMAESIPQAAQYAKQGKVKALAVTSAARNPALPDTPTAIESGVKGFEVVGFYGFFAPAGTPRDIVGKLTLAFQRALESPEIRTRMIAQGADPAFMNSEQFAAFMRSETVRWNEVVKASGAKVD